MNNEIGNKWYSFYFGKTAFGYCIFDVRILHIVTCFEFTRQWKLFISFFGKEIYGATVMEIYLLWFRFTFDVLRGIK